jgi:hypothetical protein
MNEDDGHHCGHINDLIQAAADHGRNLEKAQQSFDVLSQLRAHLYEMFPCAADGRTIN